MKRLILIIEGLASILAARVLKIAVPVLDPGVTGITVSYDVINIAE